MNERRSWLAIVATVGILAVPACFAGESAAGSGIDDDYMDDPPPPGGCATACPTPGSGGALPGGPCADSTDCAGDAICVAQFDGEVDGFACQNACVPIMDETQWCADDQSCCMAGATCSPRGFCLPPGETGGVDSGASESSGTASTDGGTRGSGSDTTDGPGSGGSATGTTTSGTG